jgi:chemotaxis protein CheD
MVTTLLGSCVSVCLFNQQARFGSINHYMLPTTNSGVRSPKYGDYAIRGLIQFMYKNGGGLDNVVAMVFGGASVVRSITYGVNIGDENVAIARKMLGEYRIPIVKAMTGGLHGLKIRYRTWDNQVQFRRIQKSEIVEAA